ncbi:MULTISPECIES: TadE/TadG family type IV pilus assembly protein [unclassified Dietzia]|uniref:TadE/TadG family type IV pilus assembly protein n=1 Tax=unclassified Dietzia TaxID=2617939 RepID=UPI0015FDF375|nr:MULTISPECIES: TadE family protein [unclassified Dietzia]MBB1024485.1 pilus assembly protein [Dietzia sp. DQ12-76]MBB1028569.1 pilus assembly protein [Dietzia sp. DQ11-38-2]
MTRTSSDRGAAALEFALVVPVLLALVLGIIEFGRAYNIQTTLSNAARDGVRVMALENSVTAARTATRNSANTLDLTRATISVTPTSCAATATTPPGTATVTITYPLELLSGFLPIDDFTLTGRGTMRCNG